MYETTEHENYNKNAADISKDGIYDTDQITKAKQTAEIDDDGSNYVKSYSAFLEKWTFFTQRSNKGYQAGQTSAEHCEQQKYAVQPAERTTERECKCQHWEFLMNSTDRADRNQHTESDEQKYDCTENNSQHDGSGAAHMTAER